MTKLLVKQILQNPLGHKWSIQGFGMLRLYLSDEVRLHVWDSRFSVPNVSTIHDHPWDFTSLVVAGRLTNVLYVPSDSGSPYLAQTIKCGVGGCTVGEPQAMRLRPQAANVIAEGSSYTERAEEIHESKPEDGTVTLVTRVFKQDRDHARVFWPAGGEWVSAEPRPATDEEIDSITRRSLAIWFQQVPA